MKNATLIQRTMVCSRQWLGAIVLSACTGQVFAATDYSGKVFYRYLNESGIPVINHQIPPEYAQKGYEVVTPRGEVVKVVPPALSEKDASQMKLQQMRAAELAKWDEELRRRYSSVDDIEAAKQRKLVQVDGRIAILQSNIRNLKGQISDQHALAARSERMGKAVPDSVLKTLKGLEEELKFTEEQVGQREAQYQSIADKYESDKDRFRIIRPE
ncbi:hypothetical protein G8770_19180 [Aestuariicella hydrocarbonica]|uniref:DUF4124 domain-containing protein n=1 Tax=Pseudomaricurvus hydrocarbonicus TaxID=1470433 RepID=A0A9E5MNV5_9GAMM|nr:PEP/pyruvate-binding domain-containing protein [Aestuariicella hydrocarbonica]NHO67675.1 hypothetical protein [Aestuariicella hydrocarbonica]